MSDIVFGIVCPMFVLWMAVNALFTPVCTGLCTRRGEVVPPKESNNG